MALAWTLLIYWLLLFVACYIVVESGQNYFYDEVTKYATLKVAAATLAMAAGLAWWDPSSLDMVTTEAYGTLLLAVAAFVAFVLVLRFHPPHALALGPATAVIVALAASLAVESLADRGRTARRDIPERPPTIRKSAGGGALEVVPGAPSFDEEPAATGTGG